MVYAALCMSHGFHCAMLFKYQSIVKVLFGYSRNGRDQTDIFDVKAEKRNVHLIHLFPLRGHALTSKLEHFQERGNNI